MKRRCETRFIRGNVGATLSTLEHLRSVASIRLSHFVSAPLFTNPRPLKIASQSILPPENNRRSPLPHGARHRGAQEIKRMTSPTRASDCARCASTHYTLPRNRCAQCSLGQERNHCHLCAVIMKQLARTQLKFPNRITEISCRSSSCLIHFKASLHKQLERHNS